MKRRLIQAIRVLMILCTLLVPSNVLSFARTQSAPQMLIGGNYKDSFESYPVGQPPAGWTQYGAAPIIPKVVDYSSLLSQVLDFPAYTSQSSTKWLVKNDYSWSSFAAGVTLSFQTESDGAGLIVDWVDSENFVAVLANPYWDEIVVWEFINGRPRATSTGRGEVSIEAGLLYQLYVDTLPSTGAQKTLVISWKSPNDEVLRVNVSNVGGKAGVGAYQYLSHVIFDDFEIYDTSAPNPAPTATTAPPPPPTSRIPVVVVHGYQGWPPKFPGQCSNDKVIPDEYFEHLRGWLEGPTFDFRYAVTYAELDTNQCFTPRVNENVVHLKEALDRAGANRNNKAIIIAHSMGGLVARAYLEGSDYNGTKFADRGDVSELFTFGTPHLGINYTTKWFGLLFGPKGMLVYDFIALRQRALEDFQRSNAESFNNSTHRVGIKYHLISGSLPSNGRQSSARVMDSLLGNTPNDGLVPTISGLFLDGDIDRYETDEAHAPNWGGTYYFSEGSKSRSCLVRALKNRQDCGTRSNLNRGNLPANLTPRCHMGNFADALRSYGLEGRASVAIGLLVQSCATLGVSTATNLVKDALVAGLNFTAIGVHSPADVLVINSSGQHAGIQPGGAWVEAIHDSALVVIGEEKYVFYPPTEATIYLRGTGNGTMTVELINTNGNPSSIATYKDVPVNPSLVAQINGSDIKAQMVVDSNGDGQIDTVRVPDAVESVTAPGIPSGPGYNFPQTGFFVAGRFWDMWQNGRSFDDSLYINGFPITPVRSEISETDGKAYQTQWFERARFEQHPENQPPYDVLLGLLGTNAAGGRQSEPPFQPVGDPGGGIPWFQNTRHTLGDSSEGGRAIARYWNSLGGLSQFGYPLSQPFHEVNKNDGKTYLVQYFERQRFEYHPELKGTRYEVLLGLLGVEQYKS